MVCVCVYVCMCVRERERAGSITCMCEWTTRWEHILTSGWWPNALKAHLCWLRGQRHSTGPTRLLLLPIAHSNLEEIPLTFHKTGEQTYKTDKDGYAVDRYIQKWIVRYNRQIDRFYSSPLTSGNPSSGTDKAVTGTSSLTHSWHTNNTIFICAVAQDELQPISMTLGWAEESYLNTSVFMGNLKHLW